MDGQYDQVWGVPATDDDGARGGEIVEACEARVRAELSRAEPCGRKPAGHRCVRCGGEDRRQEMKGAHSGHVFLLFFETCFCFWTGILTVSCTSTLRRYETMDDARGLFFGGGRGVIWSFGAFAWISMLLIQAFLK